MSLFYNFLNSMNFGAPEATAAVKPHWIKPEFPQAIIPLHMNMGGSSR
jgi:hypothetical protein